MAPVIVDLVIEDPRWEAAGLGGIAERAAAAVAAHLALEPGVELCILACDDARISVLNEEFRGKPAATNVLSWPSAERGAEEAGGPPAAPGDPELGDIAIAYDTCAREADEAGKSLANHATHLVVHGVLHLLGYDHERDADATLMEGIEVEVLGKLGIKDPYSTVI